MLFSDRCEAAWPYLSSGTSQQFTFRTNHRVFTAVHSVRLVYANRRFTRTTGERLPADALTIKAALEMPNGDLYPVLFNEGRTPTLQPGDVVTSDPIPVYLPVGARFFVRSRPWVDTLGKKWPIGGGLTGGTYATGGQQSGDQVDVAFVAGTTFTQANQPFGPVMILGIPAAGTPQATAVIMGSSTGYGSGDNGNADGELGFLARALGGARIPHFRFATPAMKYSDVVGANSTEIPGRTVYHQLLLARAMPTHAVVSLGNNDVHGPRFSLADTQLACTRYWDLLAGMGLKIIQCTVTPRTTGAWTSLAAQTPLSTTFTAKRYAFNAWVRTRPHWAIEAIWDVADIAADKSDPQRWRTDGGAWTNDGVHMSTLGHQMVGEALIAQAGRIGLGA